MNNFKTIIQAAFFLSVFVLTGSKGFAQDDKSKRASPPVQVSETVDGVKVTIDYSSPSKKERVIWGGLVPYGKVWRTGANEATWIEVSDDVKIEGEKLPKGKYALFTIPDEEEWTIIFNSEASQWGAYKYDESKDVLRVSAEPETNDGTVEAFTIDIDPKGLVNLKWDNLIVPFSISK